MLEFVADHLPRVRCYGGSRRMTILPERIEWDDTGGPMISWPMALALGLLIVIVLILINVI